MNQNNNLDKLKNYFTSEDFYLEIDDITTREFAAKIANARLAKLLESARVVYLDKEENGWHASECDNKGKTNQALLIDIQPLVKDECKHEQKNYGYKNCEPWAQCRICNAELFATWGAK